MAEIPICFHPLSTILHLRFRRLGFTFIELMMGIMLTALVMAALSSVCIGVAAGWKQGELGRSTWVTGTGVVTQLQRTLRDARYLGYVVPGNASASPAVTASVFYWRGDDFNTAYDANPPPMETDTNDYTDGVPQVGEMGLIEFDPTAGTLTRYEVQNWRKLTATHHGEFARSLTYADFVTAANAAADFKAILAQFAGAGTATVLARDVTAAEFSTIRADDPSLTAGRPVIRFTLKLHRSADATRPNAPGMTTETVESGSISLRAPTTRPTNF
jgi:hypothetical protein